MADISRAMQTPPPGGQQPAPAPVSQPAPMGTGEKGAITKANNAAREAKNERDRLRRKAKRAADMAAVKKKTAAKSKRKPAKKKAKSPDIYKAIARKVGTKRSVGKAAALAIGYGKKKKRGRGRPPGAKNKPKDANNILAPFPAAAKSAAAKLANQLVAIQRVIDLMNAMPEHARKVVLDAIR